MGSEALGPLTKAVEKALLNMKKGEECKLICRKDSGDYFRIVKADFLSLETVFLQCIAGKISPNGLSKTRAKPAWMKEPPPARYSWPSQAKQT